MKENGMQLRHFILLFIFCFHAVHAGVTNFNPSSQGLLPQPTEQDMNDINEYLSTLSEAELNELAKIGEEIIASADAQGIPLFAPSQPAEDKPMPKPKTPEVETQKIGAPKFEPSEKDIAKDAGSKKNKAIFAKLINSLLENLASIRQKIASNELLIDIALPIQDSLSTLIYYLNIISDDVHLINLATKDFESLHLSLLEMNRTFISIDNNLIVPPVSYGKKQSKKERKKEQEKRKNAIRYVEEFVVTIDTFMIEKNVEKEFEKLILKYEPEALKIKKEQDEKAQNARANAKKRSKKVTFSISPKKPNDAIVAISNSSLPKTETLALVEKTTPTTISEKKIISQKTDVNDKKEKEEDKKIEEYTKEIKQHLTFANDILSRNRSSLRTFITNYNPGLDYHDNSVRSIFLETSLHLEKATSLLPKIRKHGSGQVQTIIAHVDSIKQFFNNNHSVSTLREIGDSILDKKERLLSYSTNREFKGEIKDLYDAFHKTKTELTI